MRQIKFRGYFPSSKVAYYGDLIHVGGRTLLTQGDNGRVEVDPASVAQLIAVDKNGNEVFEGDLVERIADYDADFDRAKSFPMAATFDDYSAIINEQIILAEAQT